MSTTQEKTVIGYPAENQQRQTTLSPSAPYSSSSSSSSTFLQPPGATNQISTLIPIQPTENNYLLWKSLFISVLRASGDMLDLAEGREKCPPQFLSEEKEVENPDYTDWIRRDQMLLTWINSSLSVKLLAKTADFTSGRALWLHLETLLAEKARTRVLKLKRDLRNLDLRKHYSQTTEKSDTREKQRYVKSREFYLRRAEEIADGLEAAGSPVDDYEYVSCVLNGLPMKYNGFIVSIRDRPEPITREQLRESLLSYQHPIAGILAVIFVGFVLALIFYTKGKVSKILPIVLFVCLALGTIFWILISYAMNTESADCTDCV